MIRQSALLLAALGFLLCLCEFKSHSAQGGDKKSPAPITKPGDYTLHDGNVLVKVIEEKGLLSYDVRITVAKDSFSSLVLDKKLKKQNAVWVIYAESSKSVWVFWGDGSGAVPWTLHRLHVIEKDGVPKAKTDSKFEKTPAPAIAAMPKAMADALPKEFVEKYKGNK
jgi:hypothetical protein